MSYVGFTDDTMAASPVLVPTVPWYKLVLAGTLEDLRFAEGRAGSNRKGGGTGIETVLRD